MQKYRKVILTTLFIILIFRLLYHSNQLKLSTPPRFDNNKQLTHKAIMSLKKSIQPFSNKSSSQIINSQNENKRICNITKKFPHLFKSEVKIWTYSFGKFHRYMIKSSECPINLFSDFKYYGDELSEYIDCHETTEKELILKTGLQGDVKSMPKTPHKMNLTFSGDGFFLEDCGDKKYLLRKGDFFRSLDNTLMSKNGCVILNKDLRPFKVTNIEIKEDGCNNKECLAILNLTEENFEFLNRNRLIFKGNPTEYFLNSPYVMTDALEDIEISGGIMGPNFENFRPFNLRDCDSLNYPGT
jgi:hypothetical protein